MRNPVENAKEKLVLAHRILSLTGSMGDITGHVMSRVDDGVMLVRCRNRENVSPVFVDETAFFKCDFDGNAVEDTREYKLPPERYIAAEIFKSRPEVNGVVHAHPPAQIRCGISGVPIRPILGCGNTGGMLLAHDGVPTFERSILVASPEVGQAMVAAMGSAVVVLLRGHGNVVVGNSIEQATIRAVQIENMAQVCWEIAAAGKSVDDISDEDYREFVQPTQKAAQGIPDMVGQLWTYYARVLERNHQLVTEMGVSR